jgi:dihydroxyacetone kinase phosphoprotein-dependent L subunit
MKELTAEQTTDMLLAVCKKIIISKPLLTEIDSKIGDGDHGIGMEVGMKHASSALIQKRPFNDVNEVFATMGMEMIGSMGGASGVIFGTFFLTGAKQAPVQKTLNGALFSQMMRISLDSIKKRGGASVGDKTMVDALEPAVLVIEKNKDKELTVILAEAENAAAEGVENTKNYVAKYGRAKSLKERAIGFQDAGATSVFLIFQAMHDYIKTL